jgi:hypothetical protein
MIRRKGFVATLEAVIASLLLLVFALAVLPNFIDQPETSDILENRLRNVVGALDRADQIRHHAANRNVSGIEDAVDQYLVGFNSAVGLSFANTTEGSYSGGSITETFQVNKTTAEAEKVRVWAEEASNVTISVNSEPALSFSRPGYREADIAGLTQQGGNRINITGDSGELDYLIETYHHIQTGSVPDDRDVYSFGYLVAGTNATFQPSEVQVFAWS